MHVKLSSPPYLVLYFVCFGLTKIRKFSQEFHFALSYSYSTLQCPRVYLNDTQIEILIKWKPPNYFKINIDGSHPLHFFR